MLSPDILFTDTICAPATPSGAGAICAVRVSGPQCFAIIDRVIAFRKGTAAAAKGYSIKFGTIEGLDDVLVSIFRAPHSYTGEDSAEISCHSSSYIVSGLMQRLCEQGARPAEAGEFTRRAFLNGKMDLAQAEAVADIIAADSAAAHKVALGQLKGGYSATLRGLRASLLEICALLELELDFSEEDVEFADRGKLLALLDGTRQKVASLCESFRLGNAIKNGVPVAIAGAPNSGKSTLLNALLGDDRAIVSPIAGTTRDTVEECLVLQGVRYRFIDTAGIRKTDNSIEALGVERSLAAIDKADIVLGLIDATLPAAEIKRQRAELSARIREDQSLIVVMNKCDEVEGGRDSADRSCTSAAALATAGCNTAEVLRISAKNGEGLDILREAISVAHIGTGIAGKAGSTLAGAADATLVTNQRHYEALRHALSALDTATAGLGAGLSADLLAEHVREVIAILGTITGEISSDEVLGEIFAKFCIGK